MILNTHKVTSSGAQIPVELQIKRVVGSAILAYTTKSKDKRNGWCNAGGCNCAKFGCRPCCPPKVKMFSELKSREYMYLVQVRIDLEDYYEIYPNVRESKSWCYFGMDGTHKMTRNINNKIVTLLHQKGDQGFRVGGCLGCQFTKTGVCKNFMPALEAVGINVIDLAKGEFDSDIVWREAKKPMPHMIAVGGLYTDRAISPKEIRGVIANVMG